MLHNCITDHLRWAATNVIREDTHSQSLWLRPFSHWWKMYKDRGLLRQNCRECSVKLHTRAQNTNPKAWAKKTSQSFHKSILIHWLDKDSGCSLQLVHILYVSRKNPFISVRQIWLFLWQTLVSEIHSVGNQDRGKPRDFELSIRYGANGSGRRPTNVYW